MQSDTRSCDFGKEGKSNNEMDLEKKHFLYRKFFRAGVIAFTCIGIMAVSAGCSSSDSNDPIRNLKNSMVPIPGKDYAICKFEVTQALWQSVMGENPSEFQGMDRPVENVSWNDCQKFLQRLNTLPTVKKSGAEYRLPTEVEWKYACRAGSLGDYCRLADGTEVTKKTLGEVAWYDDNSQGHTHLVGQKKPNAFGLYDMHGNVCEWTSTADEDGDRVVRGGGYFNDAYDCASLDRYWCVPDNRDNFLGFRLARTLSR